MRVLSLAAVLWPLVAVPAVANDSMAELRTGGLAFVTTDEVEMRSEDLFISMEEVRVRYEFANTSERDVTSLVAFPMPDVEGAIDAMVVVPFEDRENFLGFTTTVNGKPVEMQVQQRASALGIDRTALLKTLNIPLAPLRDETAKALDGLPPAEADKLVRIGLATAYRYDAGKGWESHHVPTWTLSTSFYWEQRFPAGETVVVEHRYKPSVGVSVGVSFGMPEMRGEPWAKEAIARYCVDDGIIETLDRRRRENGDSDVFWESRIDYILKTGGNWSGPIRDFHLTIDKGSTENLVAFCGTDVRKTGPTTFEVRATDFLPEQDLAILFLVPQENR